MRITPERGSIWPPLVLMGLLLSLALLMVAAPVRLPGGFLVPLPNLPLMVIFIFAVRRPEFAPPWLLVLAGLAQDLLLGDPLGVWALAYLVAFTLARPRMKDATQRTLAGAITRFWAVCLTAYTAAWAAGSLAIGAAAAPGGLVAEAVITMFLFPPAAWLFARRRERATFS
jgi:rod shape-determining protein MreD